MLLFAFRRFKTKIFRKFLFNQKYVHSLHWGVNENEENNDRWVARLLTLDQMLNRKIVSVFEFGTQQAKSWQIFA